MLAFGGGLFSVLVLLWTTDGISTAELRRDFAARPGLITRPPIVLTERPPYIRPIRPPVSWSPHGGYCRHRPGALRNQCCKHRRDECSVPYYDTLCYCDEFCVRRDSSDCCPDYFTFCLNEPPSAPIVESCFHDGRFYNLSEVIKINCNQCTCRKLGNRKPEFVCEDQVCLIRSHIIEKINQGNFGYTASNYSFFWGKTLDYGYRHRLGTCRPVTPVMDQIGINKIMNGERLEEQFDARLKWPGQIQPIRDQQDFPSSWAISSVDLAADRLAIQSHGLERMPLSAQQLISCVSHRKHRCESGSPDRAFWHLSHFGVVSEDCYPYTSYITKSKGHCLLSRDQNVEKVKCPNKRLESMIYKTPPAYRVSYKEEEIMLEIKTNGPVQAILRVRDNFFMYKSGIYQHNKMRTHREVYHYDPFHSVRIIGWGVDRTRGSPVKYWLCANSWGTEWGENGYFRIVRGQDECDIESFVVGVWAKINNNNNNKNDYDNFLPNYISKK